MITLKHTFFCESIGLGELSTEESNHAIRVLRLKIGDYITLIDGRGKKCKAKITGDNKKKVNFEVIETLESPRPNFNIHIAICPTKSLDRFNFFIEKCTEIGISEISPIFTKNSERKVLNTEKIRKGLISSIKQSGNTYLPILHEPKSFEDFIRLSNSSGQRFIAHCEDDSEKKLFKNELNAKKNVVILIGPEGDFTSEEINLANNKGFTSISLGETRLRTETAGIVACHTVHIIS
jgi:16S rRNA (uracil1498-N3)-methyltransferase